NSELLVGEVIGENIAGGKISREDIVIVTKGGYIQGQNYKASLKRKAEKDPFPELVEYDEGLEHCIHPDFLEDQITKSLQRMNLSTIDIYLLHNPEYYLAWAEKSGIGLQTAQTEYYRRIKNAFIHLEKEVDKGRIKYYGISSNTFPMPETTYNFTSLERVISIACKISENNHFGVIEFPMNLFESGAAVEKNQSGGKTLLELASLENLGVLINRPLNAFYKAATMRLSQPPETAPSQIGADRSEVEITTAISALGRSEDAISSEFEKLFESDFKKAETILQNVFVHEQLNRDWKGFESLANFDSYMSQYYRPRAEYFLLHLKKGVFENKKIGGKISGYINDALAVFEKIREYYEAKHSKTALKISECVINAAPEFSGSKNVSSIAIKALINSNGVSSALVGMRSIRYVADVLEAIKSSPDVKETNWPALKQSLEAAF
ncbi:MAG TPA: aldo/keto reductase, partial [Candidatus Wallbacteria bacterium]|nr:aldo/keto reductase [Candidatus Wallbacteria bacterium]